MSRSSSFSPAPLAASAGSRSSSLRLSAGLSGPSGDGAKPCLDAGNRIAAGDQQTAIARALRQGSEVPRQIRIEEAFAARPQIGLEVVEDKKNAVAAKAWATSAKRGGRPDSASAGARHVFGSPRSLIARAPRQWRRRSPASRSGRHAPQPASPPRRDGTWRGRPPRSCRPHQCQ